LDAAILCHGLGRSFGRQHAVSDLDLTVERGSVFGFLGPNGAGKTTTVRLLLGLLPPTSGSVRVFGLDPVSSGEAVRTMTGVLLDQVGLYDRMTAWQNLEFAGRVMRMPTVTRHKRMQEVLERVALWERRNDHVSGFSKGMRQKLGLARALLGDPQLLIMDEPTSGLDPVNIKMVRDLITSLATEGGRTIFMCTHHLDEAQRICGQVGIIRSGRLVASGTPAELGAGAQDHRVRLVCSHAPANMVWPAGVTLLSQTTVDDAAALELQTPDSATVEEVVRRLVTSGAGVREVVPLRRTLEDVYLEIVQGDEGSD